MKAPFTHIVTALLAGLLAVLLAVAITACGGGGGHWQRDCTAG